MEAHFTLFQRPLSLLLRVVKEESKEKAELPHRRHVLISSSQALNFMELCTSGPLDQHRRTWSFVQGSDHEEFFAGSISNNRKD